MRVPRSPWVLRGELGIAVLEAIPGVTVRQAINAGDSALPARAELGVLLDWLPLLPAERPGLVKRLPTHMRFLETILPEASSPLAAIVEAIGPDQTEPVVTAHNDFHSAQVIVADGRVSDLVDIDTVGKAAERTITPWARPSPHPRHRHRCRAYADDGTRLAAEFERAIGPQLRPRIAASVTAFATAPFRSQQPDWPAETARRLDAAKQWLDS